ncbi:dentin sialophosphoprotein-like, partial [Stegodyphus dumicola]|uniref:dentin sialophosphoprotein-like n=1 Tax=Stegodyphus dumicola TaxID=202533 RepID=UPI0015A7FA9E
IEKVNELYTNREKMKRRKKKKTDEEEEIVSLGSSYLFEDEKLTIVQRVKKLLGLLKDEGSDSEEDSLKARSDKSEDVVKRSTSIDEFSLPDVKICDTSQIRQLSEESKGSSGSPKLGDSHSKLSLLQDSPGRTHDTLSKLSLLQDSPPNYGVSLLEDTPPHLKKSPLGSNEKRHLGKLTSESQESHDSDPSAKKQDSLDSEKGQQIMRQKSDSQDSDNEKVKKAKTNSQGNENIRYKKQKSDSQESNESDNAPKAKNKKTFEPQESKLTRRESISGGQTAKEMAHRWGKSPMVRTKNTSKTTKSLDITPDSNS